jgi:predicted dehydrogenase
MRRIHRRHFLLQSAGIGAAFAVASARAQPSDLQGQLNLGLIGLGPRGHEHLRRFGSLPNVRIAALCDVDQARLDEAAKQYPQAAQHTDLRRILDDPQIDAVAIATCNHWHALAAIWACQAGKDVYVEKPLSHSHWEGQQVVRAADKYDRIVQVGTQQRSDPLQDELKDFLHVEKALGPIQQVEVCRFGVRAPIGKRSAPLQPPSTVDYNLWLGPALDEPMYRDNFHYDWHWNWNTGNGEMGNWGVHVLDDALNVVYRDEVPFPRRITAAGGRVLWDDAGQTPNACFAHFDTGSVPLIFALSNLAESPTSRRSLNLRGVESGYVIRCAGGYYSGGRGGGAAFDNQGKRIRRFHGDTGNNHFRNFVDASLAHDRRRLKADVPIGHRSTAWCSLVDVAIRVGSGYQHEQALAVDHDSSSWNAITQMLERHLGENSVDVTTQFKLSPTLDFDAAAEKFSGPNSSAANPLLGRAYREPFKVTEVSPFE